jgi:LPXTG-motif cell wall-anchored protein
VVVVAASGLVWAFWPASPRPVVPILRRDRQPPVGGGAVRTGSRAVCTRSARVTVAALATLVWSLGSAASEAPTHAAVGTDATRPMSGTTTPTGSDGDLVLKGSPESPHFATLSPGERRYWTLEADLEGAASGSFAMRVHGSGSLVDHPRHGLTISVDSCSEALAGDDDPKIRPRCSGVLATVLPETPLREVSSHPTATTATHVWQLPDILLGQSRHLLVTIGLPGEGAGDASLMGLSGAFGVGLYAAGSSFGDAGDPVPPVDQPAETPPDPSGPAQPASPESPRIDAPGDPGFDLPDTGGPQLALTALAAGLIGLGSFVYRRNRREVIR